MEDYRRFDQASLDYEMQLFHAPYFHVSDQCRNKLIEGDGYQTLHLKGTYRGILYSLIFFGFILFAAAIANLVFVFINKKK